MGHRNPIIKGNNGIHALQIVRRLWNDIHDGLGPSVLIDAVKAADAEGPFLMGVEVQPEHPEACPEVPIV